jgi:hypothetical protein
LCTGSVSLSLLISYVAAAVVQGVSFPSRILSGGSVE